MPWGFYGRQEELRQLQEIISRRRWFFVKITGRRRIGKTSLIQSVLKAESKRKVLYIQIPDSDPAGVISATADFFQTFSVPFDPPSDLRSFATGIAELVRVGYIVALDEFQYFHRKPLFEFNSFLQHEVDRLSAEADSIKGGLIVLGSIHTEMAALLDDRGAPLFNRLTDQIDLPHLDIASLLDLLRTHADEKPERLLFLWNLFEGVPKFYRDCYEQGVLGRSRTSLLERMFFLSSSPLRTEADNWFLRELHGRYDIVLKYIARHAGCSHGDLMSHINASSPQGNRQASFYLNILKERYRMIDRLLPIFAKPKARSGRFYIRDNFLRSWLSALSTPTAAVNFRPLDQLVEEANLRLKEAEGHGFERLVGTLYEERSRKGLAGFALSQRIEGYWDRRGTELDLVALNKPERVIRLGTCKRNAQKLIPDLARFDAHISRFLGDQPKFDGWKVEKVALAPSHTKRSRLLIEKQGYLAEDLTDLTMGL